MCAKKKRTCVERHVFTHCVEHLHVYTHCLPSMPVVLSGLRCGPEVPHCLIAGITILVHGRSPTECEKAVVLSSLYQLKASLLWHVVSSICMYYPCISGMVWLLWIHLIPCYLPTFLSTVFLLFIPSLSASYFTQHTYNPYTWHGFSWAHVDVSTTTTSDSMLVDDDEYV